MQLPLLLTRPAIWYTNLSYEVTAEGVEDEAIAKELRRLGCDIAQGYYFSPPLTVDAFELWLADSSVKAKCLALADRVEQSQKTALSLVVKP